MKRNWAWLLFSFAVFLIFAPIKYESIILFPSDYPIHISDAKKWYESGEFFGAPHFLFQILVIMLKVLTGLDWDLAGLGVDLLFYGLMAYLLIRTFSQSELNNHWPSWSRYLLAFTHILVWPIFILYYFDQKFYSGYIGTNVFHNPTIIVLKPLAFIIYLQVSQLISTREWTLNGKSSLGIAALLFASTLAKPNYTLVLLPALSLFLVSLPQLRQLKVWKPAILYVLLPGFLVLLFQFLFHFVRSTGHGSSIVIAPFAVFETYSSDLGIKFLLSILYPLFVVILFFKSFLKDVRLQFAWLSFAIGAFFTYFIAESGNGLAAGNFGWSGQITLFILFIETSLFLFTPSRSTSRSPRHWLSFGILACHGICGVIAAFNITKIS